VSKRKSKPDPIKQSRKHSRRRDLTPHLHGDDAREAIERLRAAGFEVDTREELEQLRPWGYGENWLDVVDSLVVGQKLDVLLGSVLMNLDLSGMPLRVAKGARGIELIRRKSVATIRATRASFPSDQKNHRDQVVHDDYLRPGPQWAELRRRLVMRYPSLDPAGTKTSDEVASESSVVLTSLPDDVPAATRAATLEASRRIREERSHDYGEHVVRISGDDFTLRFRPVHIAHGAVEAPLTLEHDGARTVDAALRLRTPTDPLAIAFDEDLPVKTVVDAWVLALRCFAELTCAEPPDEQTPGGARSSRRRPTDGRARTTRRSARRQSGGSVVGAQLNLSGPHAHVASRVAGHRRRLAAGQRCGSEAREFANSVGITLAKTGETWVRPHTRGLPPNTELEFVWSGPGLAEVSTD
jgi:hypothetical protein